MSIYTKGRYTYVRHQEYKTVLHNSVSGAVVYIPNQLADIMSTDCFELPSTHSVTQKLEADGLIVRDGFDEHAHLKDIFSSIDSYENLHLIILPTEQCNFRCVYCYEAFLRGKMPKDIQDGIKNYVTERIKNGLKTLQVGWFGGEPLVGKSVIEELSSYFIQICDEYGVEYMGGMTTNGYFLSEEVFESMIKCKVTQYQITLDGTAEQHDKHRKLANGKPTYAVITKNLKKMAESDKDFLVNIRFNFDKDNIGTLNDFISELLELSHGDPRFKAYGHIVDKWGGAGDDQLHVVPIEDVIAHRIDIDRVIQASGLCSESVFTNSLRAGGAACYAARKNCFVIGSDGRVMKCTLALENEINFIGQVTFDGSFNIDQSKFDLWTQGGDLDQGCQNCHFYGSCHGEACPLVRITQGQRPCPEIRKGLDLVLDYLAE